MSTQSQFNTSVVLTEEQARYCEQKAAEMRDDVGINVSRSDVIRLAIDRLRQTNPLAREKVEVF